MTALTRKLFTMYMETGIVWLADWLVAIVCLVYISTIAYGVRVLHSRHVCNLVRNKGYVDAQRQDVFGSTNILS